MNNLNILNEYPDISAIISEYLQLEDKVSLYNAIYCDSNNQHKNLINILYSKCKEISCCQKIDTFISEKCESCEKNLCSKCRVTFIQRGCNETCVICSSCGDEPFLL
jgi:hypothetical protein